MKNALPDSESAPSLDEFHQENTQMDSLVGSLKKRDHLLLNNGSLNQLKIEQGNQSYPLNNINSPLSPPIISAASLPHPGNKLNNIESNYNNNFSPISANSSVNNNIKPVLTSPSKHNHVLPSRSLSHQNGQQQQQPLLVQQQLQQQIPHQYNHTHSQAHSHSHLQNHILNHEHGHHNHYDNQSQSRDSSHNSNQDDSHNLHHQFTGKLNLENIDRNDNSFKPKLSTNGSYSPLLSNAGGINVHTAIQPNTSIFRMVFSIIPVVQSYVLDVATNNATRKVFLYLLLNLSFTGVEFFYGWASGSLGLTADAVHMLFDSTALIMSLIAGVISKWPPSDSFPFAFKKVEILTGFLNALALLYASVEVVHEAIHRFFHPEPLGHTSVFIVSVLGLIVNIIGIFAFDHGLAHHGHDHGHGHDHCHSHSHGHNHGPFNDHKNDDDHVNIHHNHHDHHDHHDHHNHEHGSDLIMQGMYLHVLADTLGSVAVVISTILSWSFGFDWADPFCSILIAWLTVLTTWPLLKKSSCMLLDHIPASIDIEQAKQRIGSIIKSISVETNHSIEIIDLDVRFWSLSSNSHAGNVKLIVKSNLFSGLPLASVNINEGNLSASTLNRITKAIESLLINDLDSIYCAVQVEYK